MERLQAMTGYDCCGRNCWRVRSENLLRRSRCRLKKQMYACEMLRNEIWQGHIKAPPTVTISLLS